MHSLGSFSSDFQTTKGISKVQPYLRYNHGCRKDFFQRGGQQWIFPGVVKRMLYSFIHFTLEAGTQKKGGPTVVKLSSTRSKLKEQAYLLKI